MRQKKTSKRNAVKDNLRSVKSSFLNAPVHKKIIAIIAVLTALALLIILIIKLLSPKPKTYEEYLEMVEDIQESEQRAVNNSGAFMPMEDQLGKEGYEREILGINNKSYSTATKNQVESIAKIEINNAQTEMIGGISRPEQILQFKSDNPKSIVAQKAVENRIAMAQGKEITETLAEALYIPRGKVEEAARASDEFDAALAASRGEEPVALTP